MAVHALPGNITGKLLADWWLTQGCGAAQVWEVWGLRRWWGVLGEATEAAMQLHVQQKGLLR